MNLISTVAIISTADICGMHSKGGLVFIQSAQYFHARHKKFVVGSSALLNECKASSLVTRKQQRFAS